MQSVLKILSGRLSGVEYTLADDETVFHVGPQQDLINGRAAELLGRAENTYYLPEQRDPAAFIIQRLPGEADADASLRLGERDVEAQPWRWRALPVQTPCSAGGVHFAVRSRDDSWSPAVLAFVPPALPVAAAGSPSHATETRRGRQLPVWLAGGVALLAIAMSTGWYYWYHLPETRIRGLASVLTDAPADFDIVAGERNHLFVFADTAADRAWAERASRRLQRRDDVHVLRHVEASRLEQRLVAAGVDLVVVRLDQPAQPEVVLGGTGTAAQRTLARQALDGHVPWQHQLRFTTISDRELIALARQTLQVRGITSRVEPRGDRASVVNDVFLDDVALSEMTAVATRFHRHWGTRRMSIQPRLWDDLLQGRSYRYSPGQLLSVGSGRWDYAGATGGSP